jgi:hypothetical protein
MASARTARAVLEYRECPLALMATFVGPTGDIPWCARAAPCVLDVVEDADHAGPGRLLAELEFPRWRQDPDHLVAPCESTSTGGVAIIAVLEVALYPTALTSQLDAPAVEVVMVVTCDVVKAWRHGPRMPQRGRFRRPSANATARTAGRPAPARRGQCGCGTARRRFDSCSCASPSSALRRDRGSRQASSHPGR